MSDLMAYRGYGGSVEYDAENDTLFGRIIGIKDSVTYDGQTLVELKKDFEEAVDSYLALCAELGQEPDKPYKGTFNVRISPVLHRQLAFYAAAHNTTLNASVEDAISRLVMV